MSEPAAITAQLVDVRNVAAHKSVRLELHVPAEQAGLVMAAFGWPTMADPVPVALARLHSPAEPIAKPEAPKEHRPFSDLPYSQQAALRCQEPAFQSFLQHESGAGGVVWLDNPNEDRFAATVRQHCGVKSRADITKGTEAGNLWECLEADFYAWQRGIR